MTAYYILTQTITDLERYQKEYIPGAAQIMARHQGEVIAVTPNAEVLQGNPPGGIVIARFPSTEAIRAMVNDPDYQPFKKIRHEVTTESSAVLVPEFVPPGR